MVLFFKNKKINAKKGGVIKQAVIFFITVSFFFSGIIFLWAATLQIPDLNTFDERKVEQSTKIYDRTGKILLFDIHENTRRTIVPFKNISRNIKNATVAIEDSEFYEHKGIKFSAIVRAVFVNIGAFKYKQGGSTITQQVVKNSLLTREKTIARKLKEWILSLKLEKIYSKERILELYLNEVPYGGNIYGIEEASKAFFAKSSEDLTLVESAYLAALPQAPTFYSPYGDNREKLDRRKNLVLERMEEIDFISKQEYEDALKETIKFQPQETKGIKAPHFVFYVRKQLEQKYSKDVIETGGLKIITTLNFDMQQKAEETIKEFAEGNEEKFNSKNAGLIAIDPKTGHILAMVGSRDYFEIENDGNFNVSVAHRQPGSAFKPFVYATAFMKGLTPETIVFDLETQFHSGCNSEGEPIFEYIDQEECYTPINYDEIYRGPVTLRNALAQSINIPAIKVLYLAGIQNSLTTARNMGITSLADPARYGLTLVLGGGEVTLLEITSAYSVFANEGVRNPHTAILQIEDSAGNILEQYNGQSQRVIPKNIALQISNILSDDDARAPAFGERSYLYFADRDVAAKTGTTNDYRDAWIIGYTPNLAVGMWAGNNDNTPMEKRVAGFIVAPMWNSFLQKVFVNFPKEEFGIVNITEQKELKPILRGKWLGGESYFIDSISKKLATQYTPDETKEERLITNVHSSLYWIDKNNPRGPVPTQPENDSQFNLWETAVQKWVNTQNIKIETRENIPTEYDTIHKPEFAPILHIKNFDQNNIYSTNQQITLNIESTGRFSLSKVDLYINNIYIGSTTKSPFMFSFVPNNINSIKKENTIKIIGYDIVKNKSVTGTILRLK